MAAMSVAICELAIKRGAQGEFSANDIKLDDHGGSGIAGSVFKRLAKDEVLCPVVIWAGTDHQQKYVRNAGGNKVGVWRLKNLARAQRLLALHSKMPVVASPLQTELLTA